MTLAHFILALVGLTTVALFIDVARFELRAYRARRRALRRPGFVVPTGRKRLP